MKTTSITIRPTAAHYYTIECMENLTSITSINKDTDIEKLIAIAESEPYNLEAVLAASAGLSRQGDIQAACELRFKSSALILDVLPDDEDIILEWQAEQYNRQAVELIYCSGMDHFAFGDYEYAAGMLEMALMLDEEDHFDATIPLAFCYVALQEWELLDETLMDITNPSFERTLIITWAECRQQKISPAQARQRLSDEAPDLLIELLASDHSTSDEMLIDMESLHPSKKAHAHTLWLRTEGLWQSFPEFIDALR